ncbi:hypothetical protein NDA13_004852 [Ustilago tritici]|nr:hypothetical protein NDA13_004852 [Ustilago tritici]
MASTLFLAKPSALASALTTTATTSAPSCPTPPLPLTVFLTEDSPAFCGLQQQLNDQVSALSNIAASLQQLLASSRNPKPRLPQPPSSQPVAAILTYATLPAANTAGSALGAPLPGESDVDHIFSWLLQEIVQQVIDDALPPQDLGRLCNPDSLPVNNKHKHAVLVNGVLIKSVPSAASTSSTHHFTKPIPNVHCFAKAWTIYTCFQACATNNPNLGASLGAFLLQVIQTDRTHMWLLVASYAAPTAKPTPSQVGHLQSARRASRCAFGTMVEAVPRATRAGGNTNVVVAPAAKASRTAPDPVQVVTPRRPTGLDGLVSLTPLSPAAPDLEPAQRPPPPQGLARLVGNSARPCPNTSFASNVFDPASQPAKHSSMQERAFAWSTLLSLYPDPVYHCQLLGMTEHGCLLGYDGLLRNADHRSDNLPISLAGHSHLCREIDTRLAKGHLSIILAGTNLIEPPIRVVPKPRSTKLRNIHHLSHPCQLTATALPSVNAVLHAKHILLPVHILALAANALGLRLSPKKTFGTSTKLKVLGIEIDTVAQTIRITDNQRHHILTQCCSLLQRCSMDLLNMQQIASLLQFVSQVFPCRKAFLRRLYNTTRRALPSKCCLTRPACLELIWWCDILECWSGTSTLSPLPLTAEHIWTNACPKGYGGYLGLDTSPTAVFAKTIPCRHRKKNICFLEALAVLAALQRFLPHWLGPTLVVVHVKNENVKHGLRSGCSHNLLTQCLLQEIFGLCLKHDLTIRPQRVLSTDNVLADLLSCLHFLHIQLLFPHAHDALFSHPACAAALQVFHLVSLLVPPTSCGMALPPAPAAMPGVHPCPSSPSASNISGLAHPVFQPRASNCWSGSPTSPAVVALSTWPSTSLVPSNPTMWTLALTPQAAFALTFACFLRLGELVWDRSTDCATILTVSSVKWASDYVVLTLPASKTNPFQQGVHVVTLEVGGIECPVACLQHLSHGRPPSAPLFGLGPSGLDPLPQSTFVTILCRAIQACGLPVSQYASHSFHHGAATWVLQHGASTANIQSLGRWSSDCYCHYIDRSAQEHRTLVALALFSIRNGPLVPSGPAWRDPGLA